MRRTSGVTLFRVRNAKQVAGRLKRTSQKFWDASLARIMRNSGKPILAAADAALTGDDTGALRRSLGLVLRKSPERRRMAVYLGPRVGPEWNLVDPKTGKRVRSPVRYAHLIEFGTQAHIVIRRGVRHDGSFYQYSIAHPGTAARPFMRPAFEGAKETVRAQLAADIGQAIEKAARDGGGL
jgi:hypothetical protein